ncbi:MAG TPA: DUF488 domain-containing protein, partial [Ktedonobacterales bacterium]|nr:DUF488 domain-containing protein [Ktedonobacterales bacterium]
MSMPTSISRCTRRCESLLGAFQPSALVGDILVCRYCGETRRAPAAQEPSSPHQRPAAAPTLYTIGYGGRSLETFLPVLLAQRIHLLLDVRQTAWSANPGFAEVPLRRAVEGHGITYRHRPELGVAPDVRARLKITGDWETFCADYEAVLAAQEGLLQQIAA